MFEEDYNTSSECQYDSYYSRKLIQKQDDVDEMSLEQLKKEFGELRGEMKYRNANRTEHERIEMLSTELDSLKIMEERNEFADRPDLQVLLAERIKVVEELLS